MSALDKSAKSNTVIEESSDFDSAELEEERKLINKAQKGDELSFKRLVDKYKSQVGGLAYKMVRDYEDAKDISQNVFIKTYQNLNKFDIEKRFSTWLYRIAMNASIDFLRKYRRHKIDRLDNLVGQLSNAKDNTDEVFNNTLIGWAVGDTLGSLNEKQRSVFVLRDIEGLSIKEVSQITQMPQATVRWYLHRARAKLKGELIKRHPSILRKIGVKV